MNAAHITISPATKARSRYIGGASKRELPVEVSERAKIDLRKLVAA